MSTHTHRLAALAAAAAWLIASPPALAATHSGSVQITGFSVSTSTGTLSWLDPYQSFSAQALDAGGLLGAKTDAFDSNDFGFAVVGASSATASGAISAIDPQTFWANASSASSFGAASNLPNQGEARALQSASFSLSSAGTVSFVIAYQLDVAAPGGNANTDHGSATLALDLANGDGSQNLHATDALYSFVQASGLGSRSGSFTLSVNLAAGETGYYTLQGSAVALASASVVPEPAQWGLMAGGLLALAGRRRLVLRQRPDTTAPASA